MFTFEKIITHNFGILKGTQETDLRGKEIVGIRAEYEEDKTRSNRGGKTTWIEAFQYALTGNTRAKKEIQMIHHGEKAMWVELHLRDEDTNEIRVIKRGRDHKNVGILNIDWIEKSTDAQAEIDALLGLDGDLELTNYFRQSSIHGFMTKDPAEKGALLTKWITKGHWKAKHEKAIEDRDAVKLKLKDNEAIKKALESVMEITEPLVTEIATLRDSRKVVEDKKTALTKTRANLFVKYSNDKKAKDTAGDAIEVLDEEYHKLLGEVRTHERRVEDYGKLKAWLVANQQYKNPFDQTGLDSLTVGFDANETEANKLKDRLKRIKSLKSPLCPVLQEACDRIQFTEKDIRHLESDIAAIDTRLKEYHELILKEEEKQEAYALYISKKKDYDNLGMLIKENQSKSRMDENRTELTQHQAALELDLRPQIDKIKGIDFEINDFGVTLAEADKKIGQLEHRIKTSQDALAKIDEVSRRSAELRAELEDLNYVVFMFSRNGIPANEIENAFGDVQDNINFILDGMGCGFNINFSPDRELDKWEPICHCGYVFPKGYRKSECEECNSLRQKQRKNEITIEVTEGSKEQDFSLDSGGGQTLVSYAVRIGITMLKRDQNKNKLSVLFLDEIDSALDPYFVDQIVTSITKVLTKKLGFRQILMVSHKSKIRDATPDILQVTRNTEGYSEVAWAN